MKFDYEVTTPRELIDAIAEDIKQDSTPEQIEAIEKYKKMLLQFF